MVARIAATQQGIVARTQLLDAGLSKGLIDHRLATGRLHRVHRGVYSLVPEPISAAAGELAAVLACGPVAVISHRTAGLRWQLLRGSPERGLVDVTVRGRHPGRKPRIRVHCVARLEPGEVRVLDGVPITSPIRTVLDLASVLPFRELERTVAEAQARRLASHAGLAAALNGARGRRGVQALRKLLSESPAMTRSQAEVRFLKLVRSARLPDPEVNVRVGVFEVDFLWRERRLVVEVDGFRYHSSRVAFERDRRRDAALQASGWRVLRVTWRQLAGEPQAVVATLAAALAVGL